MSLGTDINDNSHKALIHLLNICIGLVSAGVKGQSDADAVAVAVANVAAGHFFQSTGSQRHLPLPAARAASLRKHCSDMLVKIYDWRMSKA